MERTISDEEKIRRAIEISQRRNKTSSARDMARVNVNNKKDYKLFKKMILQIIICLLIYLAFHLITTTNYAFSEEIIKNTNGILSYDINFEKLYQDCQSFLTTTLNQNDNKNNLNNSKTESAIINGTNSIEGSVQNLTTNNIIEEKNEEEKKDIEGKEEKKEEDKETEKTAMEKDAEKAKKICKFQKPLSGKITSEFGEREVTSKVMSANHKGIDIAANSGTSIKAAIEGTVSVASQNSEYGKFIKIVNGDAMTVYAHCQKLKVKEGEKVKIGQTIATVGSTGNSTGPHLHFEIRLDNRYINPRFIIDF